MCNTSLQQRAFNNVVEPFSFSTFQLLRTCNRLLLPNADSHPYYNISREADVNLVTSTENRDASAYNSNLATSTPASSPILDVMETISLAHASCLDENAASSANVNEASNKDGVPAPAFTETKASSLNGEPFFRGAAGTGSQLMSLPGLGALPLAGSALLNHKPPLPSFEYIAPVNHAVNAPDFPLMELNRVGVGVFPAFLHRRARGEKRPIPDEQKDEKYYERRKRNNEAAKKSRDARKIREDRIAFRAALLEQENSILRAQVMALRDELQTLRQLIGSTSAAAIGRGVTQL